MKILQIAPYATCNELPLLSQCKAGFGYMVYDIAKSLAKENNVEVLLFNYRHKEFLYDNILFRGSSILKFLRRLFLCSKPSLFFRLCQSYPLSARSLIRFFYVWFISGYYYSIIRKGNYDIVHIHGCGYYDDILMDVCRRSKQLFVITLHGLNSFSDSIKLSQAGKKYERDFLQRVTQGEFPITVISSGIKKTIENAYECKSLKNLNVVCNAFSFKDSETCSIDVRKKYKIPDNSKILLYVGNISRNKNQEQMIEAFDLLPSKTVENVYVLFLGRNNEKDYRLEPIIEKNSYKNHLILCGNIDKNEMPQYYKAADAVVLLSKTEGFGLSLIEGMHFGLPCMTFSDLDAFADIYDSCAVIGLSDRKDQTVVEGLERLLQKDWNREQIKIYSEKFESKAMADNYVSVYKQIIK